MSEVKYHAFKLFQTMLLSLITQDSLNQTLVMAERSLSSAVDLRNTNGDNMRVVVAVPFG
mgnify:CR=1 FL=1